MDDWLKWGHDLHARSVYSDSGENSTFESVWEGDVCLLRTRLLALADKPEVRQALFVASPSLESAIDAWKLDPDSKKGRQTERALVRYFTRMACRATPFGLFSGCSVGRFLAANSDRYSELELPALETYRASSRLDYEYLFALTTRLRNDPALVNALTYWPNSTIQRTGDVLHYVESFLSGSQRVRRLVKLFADEFLDAALRASRYGATISQLVDAICKLSQGTRVISAASARNYAEQLISNELLVTTLAPSITGTSPFDDIIHQLKEIAPGSVSLEILVTARSELSAIDRGKIGGSIRSYLDVANQLGKIAPISDVGKVFQVDLVKPSDKLVLTRRIESELIRILPVLARLAPVKEPPDLRAFKHEFSVRYEGSWVPLAEALDPDVGLCFGPAKITDSQTLLAGLKFPDPGVPPDSQISPVQLMLLDKMTQRRNSGLAPIRLEPSDFSNFEACRLPDSFSLNVSIAAASCEAVSTGEFEVFLRDAIGPSGARFFGRFCCIDSVLEKNVRGYLVDEEAHHPDAAYAEIVHLPEGRVGNVLCRPILRQYEIPYLGRSGAPHDHQLPVSDLFLSLRNESFVLFSKRLNRRVIPRMTTAHGYWNPTLPPVYRFLCLLQHEDGVGIPNFRWGPLQRLGFLPRVQVGRIVLSCAQWRLRTSEIAKLRSGDRKKSFCRVQDLRRELDLPRWIVLVEADNHLPVDLDNALSVDSFLHVLGRTAEATIQEPYPPPELLCVTGPEGRFNHQLIIPFTRNVTVPSHTERQVPDRSRGTDAMDLKLYDSSKRRLAPGGAWLYAKVYGGPASLEESLLTELWASGNKMLSSGIVDRWFFLRYTDPRPHLRLRFRCAPQNFQACMTELSEVLETLLAQEKIHKVQYDTYERELERYGGVEAISAVEHIFCADSQAVLAVLRAMDGAESETRWHAGALAFDNMLSDFGYDLRARHVFVKKHRDSFEREFRVGSGFRNSLGEKFRDLRAALVDVLEKPREVFPVVHRILAERSNNIKASITVLTALDRVGRLDTPISQIVSSCMHMHVNRLIRSAQREHEYVLYDHLCRVYGSALARQGSSAQTYL